jgi:hypothetical protein
MKNMGFSPWRSVTDQNQGLQARIGTTEVVP